MVSTCLAPVRAQQEQGLYLRAGQWQAWSGPTLTVRSPADDRLIGRVAAFQSEQIDEVLEAAVRGQKAWEQVPVAERARILTEAAALMETHAEELAGVLMAEIAKNRSDSRDEVVRSADLLRVTAEAGRRLAGETLVADAFPRFRRNKVGMTFRVPLGVILAIPPFNYPINLAVSKIAPALVSGNAVVLKPPSQGAISAHYLAALLLAAGVPGDVLHVVTGRGSEIGDYLVTHPRVNMISFTGSSATGNRIAKLAGMIPLNLELGGKDAAIVLSDADLDRAAADIVSGAFAYSGQRCTAVKRVLVTEPVADALIERMLPLVERVSVGLPEENAVVTPLISDQAADYVQELIDDALAKGARLLTGNRRQGRLLWPTLLDGVTEAMRVAWEEPFGPVLPILRVPNAAEAVRIANASEYGLQSSIFSRDVDVALQVAFQLEVGTVQINGKTARGPDHFPFLGTKSSGLGVQGVHYAIEAMTRVKSVVVNLQGPPDLATVR